jgi:phospholipase/carboxylesterase
MSHDGMIRPRAPRGPAPSDRTAAVSRRRFSALAGGALVSLFAGEACFGSETQSDAARISARYRKAAKTSASGMRPLQLDPDRDAILAMPSKIPDSPLPLLVLLHGAGGSAQGILRRLGTAAGDAGVAVLAPDSRDDTWDAIRGGFGPDIRFVSRALDRVFESVSVDPARIAIGGFSDGATYALSVGLTNGDLFRRILAFSPGFIVGDRLQGTPTIFVSHGNGDRILPIDRCSRVIVPALKTRGYDVVYREFDGGHEVPPQIARDGMTWVAGA